VFTKIDLHSAYNLVHITNSDEWKTDFHTRFSSNEFLVMHYGLTNAPASFQCFMNNIFKDLLDVYVVIYLDDILIFSADPASHQKHIGKVLCQLCTNSLFAKIKKCKFSVTTFSFLSFLISPKDLQMDKLKIQVICDWLTPQKFKDIQLFLSFTNFYQCFIASYSDITILLT
jgi:hypothetical protein